ncbi:hypothetical protein MUK42_16377 [Musa troglodytarum]|uniref:Uncharacterized protein n=1 Tax=Musa troglodytarum TaxID=320322 RepID=A0A9E7EXU4_9LILI|nr:hypothetical protein MUK42_16377 [Musa troglodytarum]
MGLLENLHMASLLSKSLELKACTVTPPPLALPRESEIKRLCKFNTLEKPQESELGSEIAPPINGTLEVKRITPEEGGNYDVVGLLLGSTNPSTGSAGLEVEEEDDEQSIDSLVSSPPSNSLGTESESPNHCFPSKESSECSISDDEGLIEIALSDGHCVAPRESDRLFIPSQPEMKRGLLPETVFRQHGIMELLSDIYEEDNLIEIDIARGSIKCSRLEIEA